MRLPPTSEKFPEVPVVPLIDVIFTLLTFFIVATLYIEKLRAIDLDLPQASSAPASSDLKQVDVTVDNAGKFFYNRAPVTADQLFAEVSKLPVTTLIILAGDKKAKYQSVLKAMDVMRKAKKTNISLAARAIK